MVGACSMAIVSRLYCWERKQRFIWDDKEVILS
jgi:hypothetical protein